MNQSDWADPQDAVWDSLLRQTVAPTDEVVAKVRRTVELAMLNDQLDSRQALRSQHLAVGNRWMLATAAALLLVIGGATGGVGVAFMGRDQPVWSRVSPVWVRAGEAGTPTPPDHGGSGVPYTPTTGQPQGGQLCGVGPSVELHGRGLAATGQAELAAPPATPVNLAFDVAVPGVNAADASAAASSAAGTVQTMLRKTAGPAAGIRVTDASAWTDPQTKQILGGTTIEVNLDHGLVTSVVAAVGGLPGVTDYRVTEVVPTWSEVQIQSAVRAASQRATVAASAAASSAHVRLGTLQSVAVGPPNACGIDSEGQALWQISVTLTYALR